MSGRKHLLDDFHRPLTLEGYRQSLRECEKRLRIERAEWEILAPRGKSYIRAIRRRRELLLCGNDWSKLDPEDLTQLKGGKSNADSNWWGLVGRMDRSNWSAVRDHQATVTAILNKVLKADDSEFPERALHAMQRLTTIKYVKHGTATLLLALTRPDRLLCVNGASRKGLEALCRMSLPSVVKPTHYRELLLWLYRQPWYTNPPADEDDEELKRIWNFRAALVDAFVYEWT